ncbi:MAG: hypothetical protein GXY48_13885 [Methanomicrobiales archaeon]|nr:hypothetical protein [Methanomicrobiales archaeon]
MPSIAITERGEIYRRNKDRTTMSTAGTRSGRGGADGGTCSPSGATDS